jgi:hypothetical protein
MGKNARDKIAKFGARRHAQHARTEPSPLTLRDVSGVVTVRLCKSGRRFGCPQCRRSHPHPPEDIGLYMIGYGVCDFYGCWMPIEGGDRLGVVCVSEDRKLYTVVYGARASLK